MNKMIRTKTVRNLITNGGSADDKLRALADLLDKVSQKSTKARKVIRYVLEVVVPIVAFILGMMNW
jgi:hypothetical protein